VNEVEPHFLLSRKPWSVAESAVEAVADHPSLAVDADFRALDADVAVAAVHSTVADLDRAAVELREALYPPLLHEGRYPGRWGIRLIHELFWSPRLRRITTLVRCGSLPLGLNFEM
jgi:hypothetical protein